MRFNEIQDLIKFVAKSGVSEVQLETDKVKLVIKNESDSKKGKRTFYEQEPVAQYQPSIQESAPAPVAVVNTAPVVKAPEIKEEDNSKYIVVKSPMIGTLYRKPSPEKDLFVNVGDEIKPGDVICIIEAMKLFNEIEAEISGKIVKILVGDECPVEYDQPLFLVDPN